VHVEEVDQGAEDGLHCPAPYPADAIVIFDGKNLDNFVSAASGGPAECTLRNGVPALVPRKGDIQTKQRFGDLQLHIE
jgi:hypothetical protein